uniref:Uncharacterized protein n=1 Tax=Anguilla anguilla TaxID=7936 RepID=A0A0E9Q6I7_ANGAN
MLINLANIGQVGFLHCFRRQVS